MLYRLGIFCSGLGAVVDTVLLIALLDPRNYRRVMFPVLLLAFGAWSLHIGALVHGLVENMTPTLSSPWHHGSMTLMAFGLLLMPAALSHIFLRIVRTGLAPHPQRDPRYLLLYLPLAGLIPAERSIAADPLGWFFHLMKPLVPYYIAWTSLICVATSIGLLIIRHRSRSPRDRRLFAGLALSLLLMTCVLAWTVTLGQSMNDATLAYLQLLLLMTPLLPIALFSYFAIRFHFLRIVVARTLLYGGIVVSILLLHWLTLRSIGEQVERSYQIDFGVIEAIVIILLVLAIEPIRERIFESLRYLLRGDSSADLRERIRSLSISLLKHSDQTPNRRFDLFVSQLSPLLRLRYAAGWLWNNEGSLIASCSIDTPVSDACGRSVHHDLMNDEPAFVPLREIPTRKSLELMHSIEASAAIVFGEEGLHGLILLGRRERNTDFGEEEANALVLVAEQLAAAIHAVAPCSTRSFPCSV
jgi:hypothetical protein